MHSSGAAADPHAPPVNDTIEGITHIPTIPSSAWSDTRYATTDTRDNELNAGCGAPATEASVWFTLPGPTGVPYTIDTTRSDYSTTVLVATGTADDLSLIACGHGRVTLTFPDELHVLVVDDVPGNGNGGTLLMSVSRPIAPQVSLTVSANGQFVSQTGTALLNGTLTCSAGARAPPVRHRPSGAWTAGDDDRRIRTRVQRLADLQRDTNSVGQRECPKAPGDKYAGGPTAVSVTLRAGASGFSPCGEIRLQTGVKLTR